MPLIHPNAPHGTISGYVNWQCRCVECTEANRRAKATRRAIRAAERVSVEDAASEGLKDD
jgi:hypothetical protein